MPLGFLGIAIADYYLLATGNLGEPVGRGRLDYRVEINPLRFSFSHYVELQ